MKRLTFVLGVLAVSSSACVHNQRVSERACAPSGKEKYFLNVDGALMALFEEYSIQGNVATFKRGVFPPSSFVLDWRDFNRNHPLVTEKHDVTVLAVPAEESKLAPMVELQGTVVVGVDAAPSSDRPSCLIIDELKLRADRVERPLGVYTGARPQ
jgi:hypothetical protein